MNKIEQLHLDNLQKNKNIRKQLCVNDFGTSKLEESVAIKSAQTTEQIAIDFIEWCNKPIYRKVGNLGFEKRVTALYPDYNIYIVIDEKGNSIFPKGKFLTTEELFQEFLKQRK